MARLLTAAAVITCPHLGVVQVKPSQTLLTSGGSPVLVAGDLDGQQIAGCTVVTNTNTGTMQCTVALSVTAGAAQLTKVSGRPALLDTAQGPTNGNPPATFSVQAAGQVALLET
jgi:hypothetical protein